MGSVSWSILLACYFLHLHDDSKEFCIIFDSVKEMLQVLDSEFEGLMPFEIDQELLTMKGPSDLEELRNKELIDVIDHTVKDPLLWKFLLRIKG